jgi:MOSC domain-containing protein YiiM
VELPRRAFGENLTTEGLAEEALHPGDLLLVGTPSLEVIKPRTPCYKLGVRFGRKDMPKLFEDSGRSGFYLKVVKEGSVKAGGEIEVVLRPNPGPSIATMFLTSSRTGNRAQASDSP